MTETSTPPGAAFGRAPAVGASWWYSGCLVTQLATATDTGGALSAVSVVIRKGMEPPPHRHAHEDEAYVITAGTWTFEVGHQRIEARPGAFVWLPRGVVHGWNVAADGAAAVILSTPGGFLERMFAPFSTPAQALDLPPVPDEVPYHAMLELDRQLGVSYVDTPGEEV